MRSRPSILSTFLFITIMSMTCWAEKPPSDAEKATSKAGWEDAWSWGNAFAVKTYFEQLYYPHAKALLDAEDELRSGGKAAEIVKDLKKLPGIKGVIVMSDGKEGDAQWPDSLVRFDIFGEQLFNTQRASKDTFIAPMMHRTVGGKVAFEQVLTGNKYQSLDLLVRYVHKPDYSHAVSIICLALDPTWLTAQIPSAMDSLYRENVQLLFAAASPLNKFWEQSLGIINGEDTLWWVGRKDLKITNEQVLWPFETIKVASYVHTLEKK